MVLEYMCIFIKTHIPHDFQWMHLYADSTSRLGFLNLIFGELNEEEKAKIEEKIIETYRRKEITFDDASLYQKNIENKIQLKAIFKNSKQMPKLGDFYEILKEDKNMKKYELQLLPFINGSLSF